MDKPIIGDEAPEPFEGLFPELDERLKQLGVDYLTVVMADEKIHVATSVQPEDKEGLALLLLTVTRWVLECYTAAHGAKMAEQFFALLVSATAQQQGWTRERLKRGAN